MNRMRFGIGMLTGVVFVVGGCGAVPEFVVDAGREAAKEAIENAVEDAVGAAVGGVVGGVADDLWDVSGVAGLPEAADEG